MQFFYKTSKESSKSNSRVLKWDGCGAHESSDTQWEKAMLQPRRHPSLLLGKVGKQQFKKCFFVFLIRRDFDGTLPSPTNKM
jgi:hypothetical protein